MISCSVGICLYNEEKNLPHMLSSLFSQKLKTVRIAEIILVISGSTDKTLAIARSFQKKNKKITIIIQKKRFGKASGVNVFIEKATQDILVLLGGDMLLGLTTIEHLVSVFTNPQIGMTGSHPIPMQKRTDTFSAFTGYMLWGIHHYLCLRSPKMGEAIAFRKIFKRIPISSSVDEANIEPLIIGQGYTLKYIPKAQIYNQPPQTINDFITQRRRIFAGHLAVKQEQRYEVATLRLGDIARAYMQFLAKEKQVKIYVYSLGVILLEVYSRMLGWWDYRVAKKDHHIWETALSTKQLLGVNV